MDSRSAAWVGLGSRGVFPRALATRLPGCVRRRARCRSAEDIAQEAFLAAVRALDRFDRSRPFGPWLHRIAVNRAIDWARAAKVRAEIEEQDVPAPVTVERDDRVLPALASLDPGHRAVIVLRYLLEYTPGEIADLLDLPLDRGHVDRAA